MKRPKACVFSIVVVWSAVVGCHGQPQVSESGQATLPQAEVLLDRFIEASGGSSAHEKLINRISKGTVLIEGYGMKGRVERYEAAPTLRYERLYEIEQFQGVAEEGTNGNVAWAHSFLSFPYHPVHVRERNSREVFLRRARFNRHVHWRQLYSKAKTLGVELIDGKRSYKIELTPRKGKPEMWYLDAESKLLLRSEVSIEVPVDERGAPLGRFGERYRSGPISNGLKTIETDWRDYRRIDEVLIPHKITRVSGGSINLPYRQPAPRGKEAKQKIILVIESVQHNVEMPATQFDLPENIKSLLDK